MPAISDGGHSPGPASNGGSWWVRGAPHPPVDAGPSLSPLTRGEGIQSLPRPACGERVGVRGIATMPLLHVSDQLQHFSGARAELLRQLVLQRFRFLDEARLVDILDKLHTDLFEPRHRLVFEPQGLFRHGMPDLVGGCLDPSLLLVAEAV